MSISFKDKIIVEYPIPLSLSVWGGDNVNTFPLADLDTLISASVDEVASDVLIIDYIESSGMITYMPESTVTIMSAKLSSSMPYQGNRLVKVTYNPADKRAFCRYYPAVITFQRRLTVDDLDNLSGDRLLYVKNYVLWKMADKELNILKTVNMNVDNGAIDFSLLVEFKNNTLKKVEALKPEILMYTTSN